jgi:hypothetical protein
VGLLLALKKGERSNSDRNRKETVMGKRTFCPRCGDRCVVWPRKKELSSHIQNGFKNAGSNDGVKEQPMFPETFEAFRKMHYKGAHGLVFRLDGRHLEYRAIQSAYDRAFKKANLPYRGTHVMRHGGLFEVLI